MSEKMDKQPKNAPGRSRPQAAADNAAAGDTGGEAAEPPSPETPPPAGAEGGKRSLLRGWLSFLNKNSAEETASREAAAAAAASWTPQEKLMLANIGELHAARVEDIMIPRADIQALDLEDTLGEALRRFEQSGHSRMPVYAETLDDPRGMIHIRDALNYITRICLGSESSQDKAAAGNAFAALDLSRPVGELGIVREVLFVPDSMPAGRLLARMQAGRIQMALVIDEHGGTDGLVSMEDIVELIVGDIEDEHDKDSEDIVREAQNSWVLDAATELEELKERLGIDLGENSPDQDVDTVGGLVVTALDRIPARGEKLTLAPHYLVQILDADRRRVKRIRLTRLDGAAAGS